MREGQAARRDEIVYKALRPERERENAALPASRDYGDDAAECVDVACVDYLGG